MAAVIGTVLLTVRTKAPNLCTIVDKCTTLSQNVMSLVCNVNYYACKLGIPSEGLLLAAAFDIIQDFMSSDFDVLLLQLELVYQAAQLGKLNTDTLHKSLE